MAGKLTARGVESLAKRKGTESGCVPFRHSLAITLYGDKLGGSWSVSPELEDAFTSSLAGLIDLRADSRRVIGARPTSQEARKRKRR